MPGPGHHTRLLFRAWLWFDLKAALHGWIPLAVGLLAWDYFIWREARPKIKGWFTRKLLTLAIGAGVAPILPWWIPAGQAPTQFLSLLGRHRDLPLALAWGTVIRVAVLVCIDAESRGYLLGKGKVLSLVSLGLLVLVLSLTVLGWSLTYAS